MADAISKTKSNISFHSIYYTDK